MIEIFQKLNKHEEQEIAEITLSFNPINYIGGSVTKHHRLIFFEKQQTGSFYIDFVPHIGTTDKVFIVPAGHLIYIPHNINDFAYINIPHSDLNQSEKHLLLNQKYKSIKSLNGTKLDKKEVEKIHPKFLIQKLSSNYQTTNVSSFQYIQQAEEVANYLSNSLCCHQLSVKELLNRLNISEKTLQRICSSIFEFQPILILRYHLTLKIVFLILHEKQKSFSEIADNLHFRDLSTFGRYVKTLTKLTPKEIRTTYSHIVL